MGAIWLLELALLALILAFFTYGSAVGRWLGVDSSRPTPAHTMQDGVDYVPARAPVLVGHHFASIAGAAPIIGPVTALAYGSSGAGTYATSQSAGCTSSKSVG